MDIVEAEGEVIDIDAVPSVATFHPSVKAYILQIVNGEYKLVKVKLPNRLSRVFGRVIAIDYHQVLDIDRSENPWVRISDSGVLPFKNCAFTQFQKLLHKKAGSPSGKWPQAVFGEAVFPSQKVPPKMKNEPRCGLDLVFIFRMRNQSELSLQVITLNLIFFFWGGGVHTSINLAR